MYHLIAEKNKSQFLRLISREYFFAKAQVNLQFSFNIKIARKIGDSLLIAHQNTRLKLNNRWSHFTLGALAFQIFHDDSMQETTLKSFVIFFLIFHTSTFLLLLPRIGFKLCTIVALFRIVIFTFFLFSYWMFSTRRFYHIKKINLFECRSFLLGYRYYWLRKKYFRSARLSWWIESDDEAKRECVVNSASEKRSLIQRANLNVRIKNFVRTTCDCNTTQRRDVAALNELRTFQKGTHTICQRSSTFEIQYRLTQGYDTKRCSTCRWHESRERLHSSRALTLRW